MKMTTKPTAKKTTTRSARHSAAPSIVWAMALVAVAAAGCSVRGGHVAASPPDIQPRLQALDFGVEYGTMQTTKFSILTYPNDWKPEDRRAKTEWIKAASNQAIQTLVLMTSIPTKIGASFQQFQDLQCIEKFRVPGAVADCESNSCAESYDVPWRADVASAELDQCKANQDDRRAFEKKVARLNSENAADYVSLNEPKDLANAPLKQISDVVNTYLFDDDLYPNGGNPITTEEKAERNIAIKEQSNLIVFARPEEAAQMPVTISMLAVWGAKVCKPKPGSHTGEQACRDLTQSNDPVLMKKKNGVLDEAAMIHDVSWDRKGRVLKFTLPDASAKLDPATHESKPAFNSVTGKYRREYRFVLERVQNIVTRYATDPVPVDLAKITGDVELLIDGQLSRKGSAQILGAIQAFPEPEVPPTAPPAPPATPPAPNATPVPTPGPVATPVPTPVATPESTPSNGNTAPSPTPSSVTITG